MASVIAQDLKEKTRYKEETALQYYDKDLVADDKHMQEMCVFDFYYPDNMAPLYHVRADAPPMLIITGDRELEMLGRYEENAYMMRMMKVAGHQRIRIYELDGNNHGQMMYSAFPLLLREVEALSMEIMGEN